MSLLKAFMMEKPNYMYATIKGSLTENDGVFSGFSGTNYLSIPNIPTYTQNDRVEFVFNFTCSTLYQSVLCGGEEALIVPYINNVGKIAYYATALGLTGATGSNTLIVNQNYWFKAIYDTTSFNAYISTDGKNWTLDYSKSVSATFSYSGIFELGNNSSSSSQYLRGSMNLNKSYIKINSTKYNLQAVVGYTVVGSPTISDGVVSGLTTSDYLSLNTAGKISSADTWEMCFKFGTSSSGYFLGSNVTDVITYSPTTSGLYLSSNGSSWDIASNVGTGSALPSDCWLRIKFTGTQYIAEYSLDNVSWVATSVVNSSVKIVNFANLYIGKWQTSYYRGSIDLNETYIKINNKLWFNGQQS